MKVFVTSHFKLGENKSDIEELCAAVHAAGLVDFSFIRDIEHYQKLFPDPKELWERAKTEIAACDALLIDLSDNPTGGRVVEAGIAFALNKPIFVIVKEGLTYKEVYNGIATDVITYRNYDDVTNALTKYSQPK